MSDIREEGEIEDVVEEQEPVHSQDSSKTVPPHQDSPKTVPPHQDSPKTAPQEGTIEEEQEEEPSPNESEESVENDWKEGQEDGRWKEEGEQDDEDEEKEFDEIDETSDIELLRTHVRSLEALLRESQEKVIQLDSKILMHQSTILIDDLKENELDLKEQLETASVEISALQKEVDELRGLIKSEQASSEEEKRKLLEKTELASKAAAAARGSENTISQLEARNRLLEGEITMMTEKLQNEREKASVSNETGNTVESQLSLLHLLIVAIISFLIGWVFF